MSWVAWSNCRCLIIGVIYDGDSLSNETNYYIFLQFQLPKWKNMPDMQNFKIYGRSLRYITTYLTHNRLSGWQSNDRMI